jgi:hypothetical protein
MVAELRGEGTEMHKVFKNSINLCESLSILSVPLCELIFEGN